MEAGLAPLGEDQPSPDFRICPDVFLDAVAESDVRHGPTLWSPGSL
jgi:hypothetical protein